MKWIGYQKANIKDIDYLKKINKAANVNDYREAVSAFQYPAQNKIFASTQGDIAISVAGVMPIRPTGNGETLTSGESSANDWAGYIPFAHAPYIINPARGYVRWEFISHLIYRFYHTKLVRSCKLTPDLFLM